MGDIIGSIFGTSSTTTQQNIPDAISQQLNQWRLQEYQNLLQSGSLREFGDPHSEYYTPTGATQSLINAAGRIIGEQPNYNNLISLDDYRRSFDPTTIAYNNALANLGSVTGVGLNANVDNFNTLRGMNTAATQGAINRSYGDYNTGVTGAAQTYNVGNADLNAAYNTAIQRGDYDLARSISIANQNADRSLQGNAAGTQWAMGENQRNAQAILNGLQGNTRDTLATNNANYLRSLGLSDANLSRELGINQNVANQGLNINNANLARALGIADADANRSLSVQDRNRLQALQLGIGATGNYIDQIARPRLEQVMALQGLERGAALPAAIARATAETAMPYLQSIEGAYGTNQANTLDSLMGLKGTLTGQASGLNAQVVNQLLGLQAAAGGRATENQAAAGQQLSAQQAAALQLLSSLSGDIGGQYLNLQGNTANQYTGNQANVYAQNAAQQAAAAQQATQGNQAAAAGLTSGRTQLASGYQNNVAQLAQALMANNVSLEQAGIAANSALGQQLIQAQTALRGQQQQGITSLANTYGSNAANFASTLPSASQTLSLIPTQIQAGRAAVLTGLQPLADFPRQLQEADFLRRQGLFTTAYTGIPYTPGGTVAGASGTGNIFDQLGGTISSGVTGGSGGFSSLGTKT